MKKFLAILLSALMLMTLLAACGTSNEPSGESAAPASEAPESETPAEPENTEIQPENTAQAQPDDAAPAAEIAPEPQEIPDVPYGVNNIGDLTPPNTINYTPVKPMGDYKPVSRGLKYFAAVLAGIILLTAAWSWAVMSRCSTSW